MQTVETVNDKLGYPVVMGDRVSFAERRGSTCWLSTGDVEKILEDGMLVIRKHATGKECVRACEEVAVVRG